MYRKISAIVTIDVTRRNLLSPDFRTKFQREVPSIVDT